METTTEKPVSGLEKIASTITVPVAKAKIDLQLMEAGFQKVQDEVNKLVINEDSLKDAKEVLGKKSKLKAVIEAAHKSGKAPFKEAGDAYDKAKNELLATLESIFSPKEAVYAKVATDVAKREQEARDAEAREKRIKDTIADHVLKFSNMITNCKTTTELLDVERRVNLSKGATNTYHEFLPEAVAGFNGLTGLITKQKGLVKELEELNKKESEATDDETLMAISEQKEMIEASIEETKINVTENALNTATQTESRSRQIFSSVTPKKRTLKWKIEGELSSMYNSEKKKKYVKLVANEEEISALMERLRNDKTISLDMKEDFVFEGLTFFVEKTF